MTKIKINLLFLTYIPSNPVFSKAALTHKESIFFIPDILVFNFLLSGRVSSEDLKLNRKVL